MPCEHSRHGVGTIMSILLARAIEALSRVVSLSSGLAHPYDAARAKELFRALRDEGEPLDARRIARLALEYSWTESGAKALGELGERIGAGGRVVMKFPRDWGVPTVARLKGEFAAERRKAAARRRG